MKLEEVTGLKVPNTLVQGRIIIFMLCPLGLWVPLWKHKNMELWHLQYYWTC